MIFYIHEIHINLNFGGNTIMRIKIVNSSPVADQSGIEDFVGMEFETVETWKSKDTTLEKGQVGVVLRSDKDLNPKNQWSILNQDEYIIL
jgi:hypothetical protein